MVKRTRVSEEKVAISCIRDLGGHPVLAIILFVTDAEQCRHFLDHLSAFAHCSFEIVTVNCGIKSDEADYNLKSNLCLRIHLIDFEQFPGAARMMNLALQVAKGDYVYFGNEYILPESETLLHLLEALQTRENCGIACGIRQGDLFEALEEPISTDVARFGLFCATKACLESLEGFDEHFEGMMFMDMDLSLRAKVAEWEIILVPQAVFAIADGFDVDPAANGGFRSCANKLLDLPFYEIQSFSYDLYKDKYLQDKGLRVLHLVGPSASSEFPANAPDMANENAVIIGEYFDRQSIPQKSEIDVVHYHGKNALLCCQGWLDDVPSVLSPNESDPPLTTEEAQSVTAIIVPNGEAEEALAQSKWRRLVWTCDDQKKPAEHLWQAVQRQALRFPLLSLVMPVWDIQSEFLTEAIESVLSQSYRHFELLLVLPASQRTNIPASIRISDPRIRVLECEDSDSVDEQIRSALRVSNGSLWSVIHPDDSIGPHYLLFVISFLSVNKSTVAFLPSYMEIDTNGQVFDFVNQYGRCNSNNIIDGYFRLPPAPVLRRELLEEGELSDSSDDGFIVEKLLCKAAQSGKLFAAEDMRTRYQNRISEFCPIRRSNPGSPWKVLQQKNHKAFLESINPVYYNNRRYRELEVKQSLFLPNEHLMADYALPQLAQIDVIFTIDDGFKPGNLLRVRQRDDCISLEIGLRANRSIYVQRDSGQEREALETQFVLPRNSRYSIRFWNGCPNMANKELWLGVYKHDWINFEFDAMQKAFAKAAPDYRDSRLFLGDESSKLGIASGVTLEQVRIVPLYLREENIMIREST